MHMEWTTLTKHCGPSADIDYVCRSYMRPAPKTEPGVNRYLVCNKRGLKIIQT